MKYLDGLAGIFFLIFVFLLINNATGSNTVIGALGSNSVNLIEALQGLKPSAKVS